VKRFAIAIALALGVAGCAGGPGSSTYLNERGLCVEVLEHWDARAAACNTPFPDTNYAQCEKTTVWIPPSAKARAACLADVDALSCDALKPLPESCLRLFPPG